MTAKARIDIKAGIIELEGSEVFVTKYLEEFKNLITATSPKENLPEVKATPKQADEKEIPKPEPKKRGRKPGKAKAETEKKAKKVSSVQFDYAKTDTKPDLKSLYEEKKPKNHGEGIAVIAYYLKQYQKAKTFSVKDMEAAYKAIEITPPQHIGQVMYNNKELGYYEKTGKRSVWKLTEKGSTFVEGMLKR